MTAAEGEPVSHVDAAWLRMDCPENPMVITAALMFERAVPFEDLLRVIEERQLKEVRFRQRIIDPKLPLVSPRWELDPQFDVRAHVHHMRVPAPADEAAFDELIGDLMSARLDPRRPLWQAYVLDDALGGTAVVLRIHHCLGDGVALVRFLLSLCDQPAGVEPAAVGIRRARKPLHASEIARRAASQATTAGRLLLLPADPPTPLRGRLGTQKRVARARPVPLEALKRAAHRFGATLNDVLGAIVAGALREYLDRRGALPRKQELRTLVPVFLKDKPGGHLGNHFGLVFLELPIGIPDLEERVREVKRRMDRLKTQDDASIAFAALDAVGVASQEIERIALDVLTRKATLVTSNVPGPAEVARLGGHALRDLLVWVPVAGDIALSVTLVSYAGNIRMAVAGDAQTIDRPRELTESFDRQVEQLLG